MLPTKFCFIWQSGFRGEDFQKSTNQKQELPVWPCLLTNRDEKINLCRGPSKDVSCQISVHLGKQFQRIIVFRNQPIRNKNCLWRPCLLTDRYKMSNLYRGPSINASYQVSVYFGKVVSEEKIFQKPTNQTQELPVTVMFVNESGRKGQSLQRTFQGCFLLNFSSFGKAISEENFFQKSTNQKQEQQVKCLFWPPEV